MGEGKVSLKREDESLFLNEISPFSESKPITNFGRTNRPRPRPTTPPARNVHHTPATAKAAAGPQQQQPLHQLKWRRCAFTRTCIFGARCGLGCVW